MTRDYNRVSMHGVRRVLLEQQAASLGLPLVEVAIPKDVDNAGYELRLGQVLAAWRDRGVETMVFGDLFLEDVRAWREQLLTRHGFGAIFPIWGRDTRQVVRDFLDQGFRAIVVCVDPAKLEPSFAGRLLDASFLADLPRSVDPCGENGEFHTFVFDGPILAEPVRFSMGDVVCRSGFWFCDLVPETGEREPC